MKVKTVILISPTTLLGLRIYAHHRCIQNKNIRKFEGKLRLLCSQYENGLIGYDKVYDFLEGWCTYTKNTSSYRLRKRMLEPIEKKFSREISTKEINRHLKPSAETI